MEKFTTSLVANVKNFYAQKVTKFLVVDVLKMTIYGNPQHKLSI